MNSVIIISGVIPGAVALLLFLIFTYLYEQSRQQYFRAWQLGWGAYTLHYGLDAWSYFGGPQGILSLLSSLLLVLMAMCIFVSTRLMRQKFRLRWYDIVVGAALVGLALWNLAAHSTGGMIRPELLPQPHYRLEVGLAAVLLYSSFHFYRNAYQKGSLAFRFLAISLAIWAVLTGESGGRISGSSTALTAFWWVSAVLVFFPRVWLGI